MSQSDDEIRQAILVEALKSAPFEGWTEGLMTHAETQANQSPHCWKRLFPNGIPEVIVFYIAEADREMLEAIQTMDLPSMKVRERIKTCIKVRLEQQLQHREAIRRAVAAQLIPIHCPSAVKSLCTTSDAIWRAAGDTSTDFNWYTKRGLLAKVYSATLLFWLNDDSEDQQATWDFLDRRIENVMQLGKWIGQTKARLEGVGDQLVHCLQKFQKTS